MTTNLLKERGVDSNEMQDPTGEERPETVIPAQQTQAVTFYEDSILLIEGPDKQIYVPLRPIAAFLGLDWPSQYARTRRDEILATEIRTIRLDRQHSAGGAPDIIGLPLDFLNGWLFKIDTRRVKPELKEKILRYQRECYRILARSFQAEVPASLSPLPAEGNLTLIQIRQLGIALQELAEQAMAHDTRLTQVEGRIDNAARFMGQIQKRLARVEERVAPSAYLTDEQEATVSMRVKALAVLMLNQQPGKNPFQGIWTELFRDLGVPDSHHIPQSKYQRALDFLETWWRGATGLAAPASEQSEGDVSG